MIDHNLFDVQFYKSSPKWLPHEIEHLMKRPSQWAQAGKFIPLNSDTENWKKLAGDAFAVPCPAKTMSRFIHASYRKQITFRLRKKYKIPSAMFVGTAPREPTMKALDQMAPTRLMR
ncbi:uncharacterized protein LOC62_02G002266 [Vanrija pseudolonga]|uniref:Uncharacterized protein n=1 Tax=Vanrija pseudolonga TaxID=143232 RepID=A0AAF0Y2C7_9TREE|nr:hypothetical protein LOC62_02G002266 [Vanrija pseudolonga]